MLPGWAGLVQLITRRLFESAAAMEASAGRWPDVGARGRWPDRRWSGQGGRVAAVPKVGALAPGAAVDIRSGVFAEEDDPLVRSRAVDALTRLEGPGARGLLRERGLGDEDAGLRTQALNALATSAGERSINVLGRALRDDPEPEVRMGAISALQRVGGDWASRDLDPEISAAAEQALAAWPEEE